MPDRLLPDKPGLWWWRYVFTPPMQLVCEPEVWQIVIDDKTGELYGTAIREQDRFVCDPCVRVSLAPQPVSPHGGIQKFVNKEDNRLFYSLTFMVESGEFLSPVQPYWEADELQRHAAALEAQVADLESDLAGYIRRDVDHIMASGKYTGQQWQEFIFDRLAALTD